MAVSAYDAKGRSAWRRLAEVERVSAIWAKRATAEADRLGFNLSLSAKPGALPVPDFAEIAFEKVVEERPDDGDRGDPADGFPARGDGGFKNVGSELECEAGDQPAGIAKPHVAPVMPVSG